MSTTPHNQWSQSNLSMHIFHKINLTAMSKQYNDEFRFMSHTLMYAYHGKDKINFFFVIFPYF